MFGLFRTKMTRIAKQSGAVESSIDGVMQEHGWTKTSRGWAGPFKTAFGQWPGIVELAEGRVKTYIRYLPEELRQHWQGVRFHEQASGWFRIELAVSPADPDPHAVIRYVEGMIVSAGQNISGAQQDLDVAA